MTRQAFKTTDVLKLEVRDTPVGVRNLVENRVDATDLDLPLGAWGFITPLPNQFIEQVPGVPGVLRLRQTVARELGFSFCATEYFPVSPGERVAGRVRVHSAYRSTSEEAMKIELLFLNANKAYVGSTGIQSTYTANGECRTIAMNAPANTAFCRLNISGYSGTATQDTLKVDRYVAFSEVGIMVGAAVPSAPTALGAPPKPTWTNILAPASEIRVVREALNLGTMNATILDATMHPATEATLRPGRPVRLMALEPGVGYKPLFTGQISNAQVEYDLSQPRPERRARIHISAADRTGLLANVKRPKGVTNMPDLRAVVEGCGVPWLINGDASQSPDISYAYMQDKASALDQISITRDSVRGYAWVNAAGVLVANDPGSMPANDRGTFTAAHYSDLGVDYDTAACINTVEVAQMTVDTTSGEAQEVVYGPYVDAASVAAWGPRSGRFRTQGVADIAAYAAAVLAANATPSVRVNSMRLPITTAAHVGVARARIDLYDTVTVDAAEVGVQANRVTAIEHTIRPDKWLVDYKFTKSSGVASPLSTPEPGAQAASAGAWTAYTPVWEIDGAGVAAPGTSGGMGGWWHRVGNTVTYKIVLRLGNSAWAGGYWKFSLPFPASMSHNTWGISTPPMGNAHIYDASSNTRPAWPRLLDATRIVIPCDLAGTLMTTTAPITWVWGDALVIQGTYEATPL